eukprot:TRINITY_DN16226_c0_g1_i2.p1 TRINITY_DN16226_c0_g1~~TRINITY_DN16226_c0_g1_i2.p1  ORF type:complete len:196 (+),score=32.30 TRINITY_DN16226_c0_g1_i2:89-676(+)
MAKLIALVAALLLARGRRSKPRVRFANGSQPGDPNPPDACAPLGVAPMRCSGWEDYLETCGMEQGPYAEVVASSSCPSDKPYLHFTGSRYCCMQGNHGIDQCCDVLATVNYGVQKARLHPKAVALMGITSRRSYINLVHNSERTLKDWEAGWAQRCPEGTFEEMEPEDDVVDAEGLADRKSSLIRSLTNIVAWCK